MANSKAAGPQGANKSSQPLKTPPAARTKGSLGRNDAGDPNRPTLIGDTPGTLGSNDHASPDKVAAGGLASVNNNSNRPPRFPPGKKTDVLKRTETFLLKSEACPANPYWPKGESGITWGVGWDAGQHTEAEVRRTWAKLDQDDLDTLATTARKKGAAAQKLLEDVKNIDIPEDVALEVFNKEVLAYYDVTCKAFPGSEELPEGVQVALISLVYNRGAKMGNPEAILDRRWEMRQLRKAVRIRQLDWIYDELYYMQRLWEGTELQKGMKKRREEERALIFPYVKEQLETEALYREEGWNPPDFEY